ncbi:MAG: two-component regulator propeller domain-containing protein, partial [Bacteroidota bacterium]
MTGKQLIVWLSWMILLVAPSTAQRYAFANLSVQEGLAQSQVFAMLVDSRGYIWMGTRGGGLCRYDGKRFEIFTQRQGLINN